jgi:hypothetical protein
VGGVDQQGVVGVADDAVAGGLQGDVEAVGDGKADRRGDVVGRLRQHDQRRVLVDDAVPGGAGVVVGVLIGHNDFAGQLGAQLRNGRRGQRP